MDLNGQVGLHQEGKKEERQASQGILCATAKMQQTGMIGGWGEVLGVWSARS